MNSPLPEENELKILDAYLAQLQAGEGTDRGAILREHSELASALDCLEALEKLGPKDGLEDFGLSANRPHPNPLPKGEGTVPRDFGNYKLLSELGRGGMGVVYKARQVDLDRVVAVKMILSSHLASPEQVRRFQAEARAAAKLRHSHIVPIHEVGQLNGQDFFTMDYIEGQSLAQWIEGKKGISPICRNGPEGASHKLDLSPFSTAVRIVSAIARAVEYLHRQGIVHRDLKPSNILLDAQGEPYLTDFGLAKFFTPDAEHTATGVIAGTPAYMAPEQAAGRGSEVGPGADVYSLGAILYELLTGAAAVSGRKSPGHAFERIERGSDAAAALESQNSSPVGTDLPYLPAENAGRTLRIGRGVGRRSGSFRPRRTYQGPPTAFRAAFFGLDAAATGAGLATWAGWRCFTSSIG